MIHMKLFKEIFGRIWAIWGLLSFAITFLIILPFSMATYLLPEKKGQDAFIWLARLWMRCWLFLIACPLRVKGTQNFAKGQSYIVTCNHNSLMDVPLSCPFIPGGNRTIAKKSFTKVPLFGWYYAKGAVLVDRKSEESRKKSYNEMKQTLSIGLHMSVYPEGTRNRTDKPLKEFYDGAFKLAVDTQTPVIPSVIFNTKKVLPLNKPLYLMPHTLKIHFLEPVSPVGLDAKALKEKVFDIMWNYYEKNQ